MPPQPPTRKPRKTAAVRTPADRKSPAKLVAAEAADAGEPFTFTHKGKTYTLPSARPYATELAGGDFMDAVLDGDAQAEARLTFGALKAAKDDIDPKAWAAIRSKPMLEFVQVVGEWLAAAGVEPGK